MNVSEGFKTKEENVIETVGSVTFTDSYRWLESDSAAVLEWQAAQDLVSAQEIQRWAGFAELERELGRCIAPMSLTAPRKVGDRWFRFAKYPDYSVLTVSDSPAGPEHILHPRRKDDGGHAGKHAIWYEPSPNGRYVALGVSEGGGEQAGAQLTRMFVVDVESGLEIGRAIPHVANAALAWLKDSSGFYFVAGAAPAGVSPERWLFLQLVGAESEPSCEPLRGISWCKPQVSADGRFVALIQGTREPRADYLLDRQSTNGWQSFLARVPAACFGVFHEDRYIAVTTLDAPKGRVVSIPLDTADDISTWEEVVPEGEGIIRSVARTGEELIVAELINTYTSLRLYDLCGRPSDELKGMDGLIASTGARNAWSHTFAEPVVAENDRGFSFVCSTMTRSPTINIYDSECRTVREITAPEVTFDNFVTRRVSAEVTGKVAVPVTLAYRRDLDIEEPKPTLIYVYGGYNIATVPAYIGVLAPFIEAGGVLAIAHVRGGGEFGLEWWRGGHQENRQASFDDTYTVAEWLIERGWTDAERLAITGLSNGGVIVCVAAVQRPELFKAGAALAPQCDLVRYSRDPFSGGAPITGHHRGLHVNGGTWRDFRWARKTWSEEIKQCARPHFPESIYPDPFAYSPYHHIHQGENYPAMLLVYGAEDVWCPPWHGRKFVARMQQATRSGNPVRLRVWSEGGHDTPMLGDSGCVAEWLGFLMCQVGLNMN